MASAVFEGRSLVNMYVRGVWVNGLRRVSVCGAERDFVQIRSEWSNRNVLYLLRTVAQLTHLARRLCHALPGERDHADKRSLRQGLVAVKEAPDIETRLNEIEKLLKNIISLPCKYSRSEIVLTFFERSSIDQVLKDDHDHSVPMAYQSPVRISEIMRSNGFCLANTETVVFDQEIAGDTDSQPAADAVDRLLQNGEQLTEDIDEDPSAYVTNLSYYQLVPFETDILE